MGISAGGDRQSSDVLDFISQALAEPDKTLATVLREKRKLEELMELVAPAQTVVELQELAIKLAGDNKALIAAAHLEAKILIEAANTKVAKIEADALTIEAANAKAIKLAEEELAALKVSIKSASAELARTMDQVKTERSSWEQSRAAAENDYISRLSKLGSLEQEAKNTLANLKNIQAKMHEAVAQVSALFER